MSPLPLDLPRFVAFFSFPSGSSSTLGIVIDLPSRSEGVLGFLPIGYRFRDRQPWPQGCRVLERRRQPSLFRRLVPRVASKPAKRPCSDIASHLIARGGRSRRANP